MLVRDLLALSLNSMTRHKVRFALTVLGVLFASVTLTASLSIGQGVQSYLALLSERSGMLRKILVNPNWEFQPPQDGNTPVPVAGDFGPARNARLSALLEEERNAIHGNRIYHGLTRANIEKLRTMPGVAEVIPIADFGAMARCEGLSREAGCGSAPPQGEEVQARLVGGRGFASAREQGILVSEVWLYRIGLKTEADFEAFLGKTVRLELSRAKVNPGLFLSLIKADGTGPNPQEQKLLVMINEKLAKGDLDDWIGKTAAGLLRGAIDPAKSPPPLLVREFPIVGIFRAPTREEQNGPWNPLQVYRDLILPCDIAADIFWELPGKATQGLNEAVIVAKTQDDVGPLIQALKDEGFRATGLVEHIQRQKMIYLMIFAGMTCVAMVALFVAGLGIANTLLMSVLERTREIGIWKALGASRGLILGLFLIEGAWVGLLGGVGGLILTWVGSFPGDAWIRSMVFRELKVTVDQSLFAFPVWLLVGVPCFSVAVTILAGWAPARRAAGVDPVVALRHD